jgi:hypothetical protein
MVQFRLGLKKYLKQLAIEDLYVSEFYLQINGKSVRACFPSLPAILAITCESPIALLSDGVEIGLFVHHELEITKRARSYWTTSDNNIEKCRK